MNSSTSQGGTALAGLSGLPVLKASTSKEFQAKTFSAALRPGSPQSGSISGAFSPPSISSPATAWRTELGIAGGRHSGMRISPLALVRLAMAWARMMPGLASKPPQLPEWWPPSRRSTVKSKLKVPREPRKMVGRSGARRGPSEAMKTSAAKRSRSASQNSRSPGEPASSPVSISTTALNPRLPRSASTASMAARLMLC